MKDGDTDKHRQKETKTDIVIKRENGEIKSEIMTALKRIIRLYGLEQPRIGPLSRRGKVNH